MHAIILQFKPQETLYVLLQQLSDLCKTNPFIVVSAVSATVLTFLFCPCAAPLCCFLHSFYTGQSLLKTCTPNKSQVNLSFPATSAKYKRAETGAVTRSTSACDLHPLFVRRVDRNLLAILFPVRQLLHPRKRQKTLCFRLLTNALQFR